MTRVRETLEGGTPREAPTVKVTKRKTRTRATTDDGMQWWVEKTQVKEGVWADAGCYAEDSGVVFDFGEGVRKIRTSSGIRWEGTTESEAPPLWPAIPDALPAHISIWEGESDAGTARMAQLPLAFAVTKGAKARLPTGAFEALRERGVHEVTVGADTDESGQQMLTKLSRQALGAGLTVNIVRLDKVLDPFSGINDLNGTWRNCSSLKQFKRLVSTATEKLAARIQVYTPEEMEIIAKEEVSWLIPDLIAPGDKVSLVAPMKTLKSWLTLELTRSLTTCRPFLKRHEWTPNHKSSVLLVEEEGSKALWARRVQMLNLNGTRNAHFAHRTGFKFTQPEWTDEIIALCRELKADAIFFDPLQRMIPGLNENDASEVGVVWDEVQRMQEAIPHLVVMIVLHASKSSTLEWTSSRGSSRHGGEVDLGLFLDRHPTNDNTLSMRVDGRDIPQYLGTGETFDVKYTLDREKRVFDMDATEISVHLTSSKSTGLQNRDRVLAAVVSGSDTRTRIMHACEMSDNSAIKHLKDLMEEGQIEEHDNGPGKPRTYTARVS